MSRNHDGMTHYVGDDCPGGHAGELEPEDGWPYDIGGRDNAEDLDAGFEEEPE